MRDRIAVLLLNLGGPDSQDAIKPFLTNLFADREIIRLPGGPIGHRIIAWMIVRARLGRVKKHYAAIGGRSPILELTNLQARALEQRLRGYEGIEATVLPAMRYWHPSAAESLARVKAEGIRRIVGLTLYPHYSMATTGSSVSELRRLVDRAFKGQFELSMIERWPTLPGYLDALAGRVREALMEIPEDRRGKTTLLFSAHGLPVDFIERGDPYVDDIKATMEGVVERLPDKLPYRLAYQSRVGPVKWLEPTSGDTLRQLAAQGCRDVVIIPISFVSDHIETLYEIDRQLAATARELGYVTFKRTRALNDDPTFIAALAGLVRHHLIGHSL